MSYSDDYVSVDLAITFVILDTLNIFLIDWLIDGSRRDEKPQGVYIWRYIHCVPKNDTRVILNILYNCKSVAMKFSTWYPDGLS